MKDRGIGEGFMLQGMTGSSTHLNGVGALGPALALGQGSPMVKDMRPGNDMLGVSNSWPVTMTEL